MTSIQQNQASPTKNPEHIGVIEVRLQLPSKEVVTRQYQKTSTVRTIRDDASKILNQPAHLIQLLLTYRIHPLSDATPLMAIGLKENDTIIVELTKPELLFSEVNKTSFQLPFNVNSTVKNAKEMLTPKLRVMPDEIELKFGQNIFEDKLPLTHIHVPPARPITVSPRKPKPPEHLTTYLFMMQHEAQFLDLEPNATVSNAIDELMKIANDDDINMKLNYNGIILSKEQKLSDLKVKKGECIVVEIEMIPMRNGVRSPKL